MPPISRLLTALLASLALTARAQTFDLRRDFGAVGDGRADDQPAFARAAAFFNRRATTPAGARAATLRIPAGTYRVGEPGVASVPPLLPLRGCRHLTIAGADSGRSIIRYADGLRYGAFDPATGQPYEAAAAYFTDPAYAASPGPAIELAGCDDVAVRDLTLDGNSTHFVVGGHWGDTGIQLPHDGVLVRDSRRVRLRQLAVHHFGRDGVQVYNHLAKSLADPDREGIVLENSRFDYNGRQGLSITGVNGLRAARCSFSHTGRVAVPALGRLLFSNPGAGIDIEPEGGFAANIQLESCRLVDNAGQALVADRYGDGPATTAAVVLRNCLLWGTTNWSVWLRQPGFWFEGCRLYGAFEHGCRAREANWETRFVSCTFADLPYHGQPAYGVTLLDSDHEARGMTFEHCRFAAHHGNLLRAVAATPDSAGRFRLRNCTLLADQATAPLAGPEVLAGAELSGEVALLAGPARADTATTRLQLGQAGTAPPILRAGARLRLLAPGCRVSLPGGLRLEAGATLEIGPGASLALEAAPGVAPELVVARGGRLLVRPGGTLVLGAGTRTVLAGRIKVASGGRLVQAATATVERASRGRLVQATR